MRLIQYRTKTERTAENRALIAGVFAALNQLAPQTVGYLVLELGDGTFLHLVDAAPGENAITSLPAFKAFSSGVKDRQQDQLESGEVKIVGNYRMLPV